MVICSGSRYQSPIKEHNVILATRTSHLQKYYEQLSQAKRVLVVGGGLVGVELSAELCTLCLDKKVILVHDRNVLMERNQPQSQLYATCFLKEKGVKIIYGERVIGKKGRYFFTNKNSKLTADLAIMCTGIKPNNAFLKECFMSSLNERGQLIVNEHLQVNRYTHIFAAGDINDRSVEKTAQNALLQAKIVAYNIRALEHYHPLKIYHSQKTPLVISLGKYDGIFEWHRFVFTGLLPGILKTMIEKREMWKYRLGI